MSQKNLKITLKRSTAGKKEDQRKVLSALGLRNRNQAVVKNDTSTVRGMVGKVSHLIEVKDAEDEGV